MMKSILNEEPEKPGKADEAMEKFAGGLMKFDNKFLEQRKVFLWGPVHDESAEKVVNRLLFLEANDPGKDIFFYINSPGGVVTSGMVIYDTMKLISSPVHTICMGLAASMGSILLSGGVKGKRLIFPNGRVMIHQPSLGGMYGQATDIEITAKEIQKTKELSAKILADNCGKPFEKIMKDFDRDHWMNAQEALEYGIVDGFANSF
ncbi:MAG: ATP-dependent Clp protease proteolytic subunit [Chitinophagales bacterium]|nr:ATP-dependent Clp protease proteolytic subunit [Chitinophagales bacterium]